MQRIAILLLSIPALSQSPTENYVLSRTYRVRGGEVSSGTKYWGNPDQVQTSVGYLDGLGKSKQNVTVAGTPKKKDIASVSLYNSMHELEKAYLPVAMPDGKGDFKSISSINTAAASYYNAAANVGDPTANAWVETLYDNSPLNRVKTEKAPGVTTGVRKSYRTNQSAIHNYIKLYKFAGSGILDEVFDNYGEGTLSVVESLDEDGKKVEEFVDRNGRIILKRVAGQEDTYYVFNEKGQLRYVLQPRFQDGPGTFIDKLARYAFQYTYDHRGRMITKRIPGQGTSSMVYNDNTDMLVSLKDGNNQDFYYKYDGLNRQTEMGFMSGTVEQPLVKTQYDNYTGVNSLLAFKSQNAFEGQEQWPDSDGFLGLPASDPKKGLITQVSARVLDAKIPGSDWVTTVFYYDKKGRKIQTQRSLHGLGADAREQISYQYDFAGNVVREHTLHDLYNAEYHSEKAYTYDHQNRQLSIIHTFHPESGPEVVATPYTHVSNTYNDIGLLAAKSFHNGKQKLGYQYTPRGWLFNLQNKEGGKTYKFDVRYNANGNINNLVWQTDGFGGSFNTMSYDGSNRLTGALGAPYSEYDISYDKNGNILALKRGENGSIDNLQYQNLNDANDPGNYQGNQLMRITDTGGPEGFNNGNSGTGNDYAYDQNGNLLKDENKGITDIAYNIIDLPLSVTMSNPAGTLRYVYDGAGNKLVSTSPSNTTVYAGPFEYTSGGQLLRLSLEEGQLVPSGDDFVVNYYLRDHLGNVRMVIDQNGEVLQETEYYAFGMPVRRSGTDASNKYQFLGKESQNETKWIDLQARFYDPTTGRFMSVDPVTDGQEFYSPYHYSFNNPLRFSDPDGKWPGEGFWKAVKAYWNRPLTKDQRAMSRAYNIALTGQDFESSTQGELNMRILGVGMMYSASHGKPGATSNRSLPRKIMQRNAPSKSPAAKSSAPTGTATAGVTTGKQNAAGASVVTQLLEFSGTDKAWATGATPNSKYTYLDGTGQIAVSNYIYDADGKVIFQVDFGMHDKNNPSGHGHEMTTPGNFASGHKPSNHVAPAQVNPEYKKIPEGIRYSNPPVE